MKVLKPIHVGLKKNGRFETAVLVPGDTCSAKKWGLDSAEVARLISRGVLEDGDSGEKAPPPDPLV